jgi:3',5'-cyclic AMP phosphodiesterase CpdA
MSMLPRLRAAIVLLCVAAGALAVRAASLPNAAGSLKIAVMGDSGTGDREQFEVAAQMTEKHRQFKYDLVLMVGDNFYGSQRPADLAKKFGTPFKELLDAGVSFRAALGNHDDVSTINYAPINMGGQRYYTYARGNVRFLVLDTNILDAKQVAWAEAALQQSREDWKIAYFHHPLYSSAGRHGANVDIRVLLEPLFVKYGVNVVFSGHDHVYERIKPQQGIYYFVAGSGGKLRKGDLRQSPITAAGYDRDRAFMLLEIQGDDLFFEAISRTGVTVDSGQIRRQVTRIGS